MLVLSRKSREQIQIGSDITITILRIKGGVVRVGIEAPRDVNVLRAELEFKPSSETAFAESDQAQSMPRKSAPRRLEATVSALANDKTTPTRRFANSKPMQPQLVTPRIPQLASAPLSGYLSRR